MIIDGAIDGDTEATLARRIGVSPRHLRRLFLKHLGATPTQLARSRRAHFARRLLDDTDLTVVDIAFASGFGSLRQFNRTMQEVFHASPTDLRDRRHCSDRLVADGGLVLQLSAPPGYDWDAVRSFLTVRGIPGVEVVDDGTYRRTITVDGAPGLLEISSGDNDHLLLRAHLPYWGRLIHLVGRVERLLGIDIDHTAGIAALSADAVLDPIVRDRPGLAAPGTWSPLEIGVRTVLSRGGTPELVTHWLEAIVTNLGTPVHGLPSGLTHTFPDPEPMTATRLLSLGLSRTDAIAIAELAAAVAANDSAQGGVTSRGGLMASPRIDWDLRQHLAFRLAEPVKSSQT